jgi:hypothetical protein
LSNGGLEEKEKSCDLRSKTHRLKLNNLAIYKEVTEGCQMELLNELFPLVRQVEVLEEERDSLSSTEGAQQPIQMP